MPLSQLLIDTPLLVSPEQVERSPSPEESYAYPAVEKPNPRDPLRKEMFEKDMIIFSCGLTNFEDSNLSNGQSHEFSNGCTTNIQTNASHGMDFYLRREAQRQSSNGHFARTSPIYANDDKSSFSTVRLSKIHKTISTYADMLDDTSRQSKSS